jgi:DNA-binding response OmpR family regulator
MLDLDQHCVRVGNRVVAASNAEFDLLHLLISRRNLPMSKDFIMSWLFGHDHGRDLRQVDMFVARLRKSLAAFGLAGLISTISGRGYAVLDERGNAVSGHAARPHGWEMAALAC